MSDASDRTKREITGAPPDVAGAAKKLDEELRRFEELVLAAAKVPLGTRKNIERAARGVKEAAESHERLATLLTAFMTVLGSARERQESCARLLVDRGNEIGRRSEDLAALLADLDALGREAQTVNEALAKATAGEGAGEAFVGLDRLAARAGELAKAAKESGFEDVEREADSVKQRIDASRKKLGAMVSKPN